MQQELVFSLPDSTAKTVQASICKIAFKTIPRCGIASFILLCMGLYFLFPACKTFQRIQSEKNTPYELTATTETTRIDLNTLIQIEGVERISPVLNLNATLSMNEYTLDCEIRAVHSNFLGLTFIQGTMYPDSSNVPYLILNKAAAKAFSHEYQTITISSNDTVMMNAHGAKRKAIVSGIFDDGSETPIVYMSYDVAQKEYDTGNQTELVFLLNNMGSADDVVSALQRQNIYASFDSNLTLAWELRQKQCWQTVLLSVALLFSAVSLIREKRIAEIVQKRSETKILLLLGLTVDTVETIYPMRIAFTGATSMLIAVLTALLMGTFSMLSMVICIGFIALVILFLINTV